MFWDPTFLLLIPAMIFAFYAQRRVSSAYGKYSQVGNMRGMTGYQAARHILHANGLTEVSVEEVGGKLSDHYDPRDKTVRLSSENYHQPSVAALSIAAHEVGHALQHAQGYAPLKLRHSILPVSNFGSMLAFPLAIIGLLFSAPSLISIGILVFTAVIAFHLVTLPVEFNASSRAIEQLTRHGLVAEREAREAKKVLNAAALTYVAAASMAVVNLIRLLILRNMADD